MALMADEGKLREAQEKGAGENSPNKTAPVGPVIEVSGQIDYNTMLESYNRTFKNLSEGHVVAGIVLKVTDSNAVIDVGFKSEGSIPLEEFRNEQGKIDLNPGDKVDVLLESAEDRYGHIVLSREKAERMKIWDTIEEAEREQTVITGRVIERIKGGLAVDVGIRAFLPGSQVDVRPTRNLDSWRGQEIRVRVIKVNRRRGNIVLSRKAVLEEEYFKQKEGTLRNLQEGAEVSGVVKNLTDYGAFVDLGGIDGLLHITDMSWGRVNHPSDIFRVGDQIRVLVLKFDRLEEKVSLGYKQLTEDPWLSAPQRYPVGARLKANVVSLADYGAFVELEKGIEGLIHVSEMTWKKRVHPSKLLTVGEEVEAVVLEIDAEGRRISLGTKQIEPNPWQLIEEKYAINTVVTGTVRNLTDFGAFVEVEEGVDGLVHISDLSWTKKVNHPSEILKKGEEVNVVVLNVDAANQRLSLGIKQLGPDRWEEFFSQHQIGDVVQGKIIRLIGFGAFVELSEGIEGLCHVSELDEKHIGSLEDAFTIGQELTFKVIKLNLLERKIGLSIRALKEQVNAKDETWSYAPEVGTASLGEIAREQLDELKQKAQVAEGNENEES